MEKEATCVARGAEISAIAIDDSGKASLSLIYANKLYFQTVVQLGKHAKAFNRMRFSSVGFDLCDH